ncbi:MAG: branched-chain amino acid ABC transporter permease [Acetivibrionales bacterium]|jgi:branched-chain amino acid transport system permease protein
MTKLLILSISGIMLGCVYGLIALGYSLIYKASGLMSFIQGDIMTLGAFLGLTFFSFLKLPYWLSLLLTIAIAFMFGVLIEKGVIRKLLNKNVLPIYVVLATIAISFIVQNGSQIVWGAITFYFPSVFSVTTIPIFGVFVQPEVLLCVVLSIVCMVLLHLFMTKTKLGTAMRASSMDGMAAEACGINVSMTTGITWAVSAALAAIAGMLIGPMYGVYSALGATIGRKGFSGAVIGGYGNMYGAMIGGVILGILEIFTSGYISSMYKNLIAYILLILFLFVRPTGLLNEKAIQDV